MILFAASFGLGFGFSPQTLVILIVVPFVHELVHELGQLLGMWVFGYSDLTMFFVPFLGALASGRKAEIKPWQEAIVLVMGPLPGYLLGLAILFSEQPVLTLTQKESAYSNLAGLCSLFDSDDCASLYYRKLVEPGEGSDTASEDRNAALFIQRILADLARASLLRDQIVDWDRPTDGIALHVVDVGFAQLVEHALGFDKFSNHFHIQAMPDLGHGTHEHITLVICDNIAHEFTIDLEIVDRELLQITE